MRHSTGSGLCAISLLLALSVSACDSQPWGVRLEPSRVSRAEGRLRDGWVYVVVLRFPWPGRPPSGGRNPVVTELENSGVVWSLAYADGTPIAGERGLTDTFSRAYDGQFCRVLLARFPGNGGVAHLEAMIERMPEALAGREVRLVLERTTRPEDLREYLP